MLQFELVCLLSHYYTLTIQGKDNFEEEDRLGVRLSDLMDRALHARDVIYGLVHGPPRGWPYLGLSSSGMPRALLGD